MTSVLPRWTWCCILSLWVTMTQASPIAGLPSQLLEWAAAGQPLSFPSQQKMLHPAEVRQIYDMSLYKPVWFADETLTERAYALVRTLEHTDQEGLPSQRYHTAVLSELLGQYRAGPETFGRAFELELLLTDAMVALSSDRLTGRFDPRSIDSVWREERTSGELAPRLYQAIAEDRLLEDMGAMVPTPEVYQGLSQLLTDLRETEAQGGWPMVSYGPTLRPGQSDSRVIELRRRLIASGDMERPMIDTSAGDDETLFDEALVKAVRFFQERHGLKPDAIVGKETLAMLNTPISERIEQVRSNLERRRWTPTNLGDRYVVVNIADYRLDLVDHGRTELSMRVVVGKPYRRTPAFSGLMTYLVVNPLWEVPTQIAEEDMLERFIEDPEFISKMGFRVYKGWGREEAALDPETINWEEVKGGKFPYRLQQAAGPMNALGRIKFMFPNEFNVYLHDTPSRSLFYKSQRAFSSGCIRLERPLELAAALIGSKKRTGIELDKILASGEPTTLRLPSPVPVHLQYWTAWMDDSGVAQFRKDVYGRDARLQMAFEGKTLAPEDNEWLEH
ncbi:L,D-transpeptidase family protein [Hahella sp. CR1]|uniref:L,D-transpeptidase family protein n=1 Tax=Hahella sp. CR1 TaxID=2992807 RepID=UPI0024417F3F|nr:L,D-transpeptidase family protein [Hahella sp. CR1]MDG9668143.1 L,D-transpeptidase family protein [Hahella sp. CR1]